jgi:hypothetical protein
MKTLKGLSCATFVGVLSLMRIAVAAAISARFAAANSAERTGAVPPARFARKSAAHPPPKTRAQSIEFRRPRSRTAKTIAFDGQNVAIKAARVKAMLTSDTTNTAAVSSAMAVREMFSAVLTCGD